MRSMCAARIAPKARRPAARVEMNPLHRPAAQEEPSRQMTGVVAHTQASQGTTPVHPAAAPPPQSAHATSTPQHHVDPTAEHRANVPAQMAPAVQHHVDPTAEHRANVSAQKDPPARTTTAIQMANAVAPRPVAHTAHLHGACGQHTIEEEEATRAPDTNTAPEEAITAPNSSNTAMAAAHVAEPSHPPQQPAPGPLSPSGGGATGAVMGEQRLSCNMTEDSPPQHQQVAAATPAVTPAHSKFKGAIGKRKMLATPAPTAPHGGERIMRREPLPPDPGKIPSTTQRKEKTSSATTAECAKTPAQAQQHIMRMGRAPVTAPPPAHTAARWLSSPRDSAWRATAQQKIHAHRPSINAASWLAHKQQTHTAAAAPGVGQCRPAPQVPHSSNLAAKEATHPSRSQAWDGQAGGHDGVTTPPGGQVSATSPSAHLIGTKAKHTSPSAEPEWSSPKLANQVQAHTPMRQRFPSTEYVHTALPAKVPPTVAPDCPVVPAALTTGPTAEGGAMHAIKTPPRPLNDIRPPRPLDEIPSSRARLAAATCMKGTMAERTTPIVTTLGQGCYGAMAARLGQAIIVPHPTPEAAISSNSADFWMTLGMVMAAWDPGKGPGRLEQLQPGAGTATHKRLGLCPNTLGALEHGSSSMPGRMSQVTTADNPPDPGGMMATASKIANQGCPLWRQRRV